MSAADETELDRLQREAYKAEGEEKVRLLEEAARLADTLNDVEAGMDLRDSIVDAANWAGLNERAMAAFSWMLAKFDADEQFAHMEHHLLWYYKWIMDDLHEFPQVSRKQLESAFADMERRYQKGGYGLRAVHKLRALCAQDTGDDAVAAEYFRKWQDGTPDSLGDCEACEINSLVTYQIRAGDHDAAFVTAEPLITGRSRCREVPEVTYSRLLIPYLLRGRYEETKPFVTKSARFFKSSNKFLLGLGEHIIYWSLLGEYTKAIKIVETRIGWAFQTRNQFEVFGFFLAVEILVRRIAAEGKKSIKLRLPSTVPWKSAEDKYEPLFVAQKLRERAEEIAKLFDKRNGNDHFTRRMDRVEEMVARPKVEV